MIDYFNKYYLNSEKIEKMFRNTQTPIIFDTSALLALYFYSENTRNEIFTKIFDYCYDRLWIPAQAFFEYQKNHDKVSKKPIDAYNSLIDPKVKDGAYIQRIVNECETIKNKSIPNIEGFLKTAIEKTCRNDKHPYIESTTYTDLQKSIDTYKEQTLKLFDNLNSFSEKYNQIIKNVIESINNAEDKVYDVIVSKFKIGSEFSYDEMMSIAREGNIRFSEQIPPGYEDDEKLGLQKYGDLFFWKQLLKYASSKSKKDVILVTNDTKEDWFEEDKKTPRFELLKEFNSVTGKSIWMLSLKDFIFTINKIIDTQLDSDVITELENTEKQSNTSSSLHLDELENQLQTILSPIDVWLNDSIPINDEIRLFDKPVLYKAESSSQEDYRITVTIVNGKSYAKTLHALANPFEIKKYYQRNNERYKFINVVILRNSFLIEELYKHLDKKTTKKNFNDKSIRTIICTYNSNGILEEVTSNYAE